MRPIIAFLRPASNTSSRKWSPRLRGPQKYTGRSMKDSHQNLMITAAEWEAFLDDLQQTLDKFAVPQAEQAEIKAIIDTTG